MTGDRDRFVQLVQPLLDEPVLATGLFHGTDGLAGQFLIAVTPTRVHAFAYASGQPSVSARHELAVWERSGLVVTAVAGALETRVTIEPPAGRRVLCSTGGDERARSVVQVMRAPAGVPLP